MNSFEICTFSVKITGCPRPEFTERKGYNSEMKHFWPHIGKDQMCFRSKQFFYIYQLFVYKKYINAEKNLISQSCFRGLVDRRLDWYAKGPEFESYPGKWTSYYFYQKLLFFSRFLKIKICQINCFDLKHIWSLPMRGQKCLVSEL